MAKVTLKKINQYLGTLTPHFELVKGNGYFYFAHTPDAPTYLDVPESIYVCHLNQQTLDAWQADMKWAVNELNKIRPELFLR